MGELRINKKDPYTIEGLVCASLYTVNLVLMAVIAGLFYYKKSKCVSRTFGLFSFFLPYKVPSVLFPET